jgi:hypothetical protein
VSCVSVAFSVELTTIFESSYIVQHKTGTFIVFNEFKTMLEDQMNAHIKMLYQNILGWTEENLKTSVEITVRQGEISELPNV